MDASVRIGRTAARKASRPIVSRSAAVRGDPLLIAESLVDLQGLAVAPFCFRVVAVQPGKGTQTVVGTGDAALAATLIERSRATR